MYIQNLGWFIWGVFIPLSFYESSQSSEQRAERTVLLLYMAMVMGIKMSFLCKNQPCKSKNKLGCISIVNVHVSQELGLDVI